MKLNINCCRDILLYLEENLKISEPISLENLKMIFSEKFTNEEIDYCSISLEKNKFINANTTYAPYAGYTKFDINNILLNGHEFINTFRSDEVWNEAKLKAEKIDIISFQSLFTIANKILKEKIDKL